MRTSINPRLRKNRSPIPAGAIRRKSDMTDIKKITDLHNLIRLLVHEGASFTVHEIFKQLTEKKVLPKNEAALNENIHNLLDTHITEHYKEIEERINVMEDISFSKMILAYKLGMEPEELTDEKLEEIMREEEKAHEKFLRDHEKQYGVKLKKREDAISKFQKPFAKPM